MMPAMNVPWPASKSSSRSGPASSSVLFASPPSSVVRRNGSSNVSSSSSMTPGSRDAGPLRVDPAGAAQPRVLGLAIRRRRQPGRAVRGGGAEAGVEHEDPRHPPARADGLAPEDRFERRLRRREHRLVHLVGALVDVAHERHLARPRRRRAERVAAGPSEPRGRRGCSRRGCGRPGSPTTNSATRSIVRRSPPLTSWACSRPKSTVTTRVPDFSGATRASSGTRKSRCLTSSDSADRRAGVARDLDDRRVGPGQQDLAVAGHPDGDVAAAEDGRQVARHRGVVDDRSGGVLALLLANDHGAIVINPARECREFR